MKEGRGHINPDTHRNIGLPSYVSLINCGFIVGF